MKKIVLMTLLFTGSYALATDWEALTVAAPSLKQDSISFDENGLIKVNVVKLPSGKTRLVSVASFVAGKKPILTLSVEAGKNIQTVCRDSIMFDKKFKAQLVIQTNPLKTNSRSFFGPDFESFENPVKVGPAKIKFFKTLSNWTRYDRQALESSRGRLLTDYYEELFNAQVNDSADGVLRLDLSDRNALACDLATGTLVFETTRVLEYEKGLPDEKSWISTEQFVRIFQSFWRLKPLIDDVTANVQQNELAAAVALGIATQKIQMGDDLLASPSRLKKFLASVKADARGLNAVQKASAGIYELSDNWSMNKEYLKPAKITVQQNVLVGEEPVFVKYEN